MDENKRRAIKKNLYKGVQHQMKQDNDDPTWPVQLVTYILYKHNGNISAFARTQDVRQDQAGRWLKRNCVVVDGVVYCEVSKKVNKLILDNKGEMKND